MYAFGDSLQAQRLVRSTARARAEIAADFPFDIPLRTDSLHGGARTLTSAQLLGPHLGERPVVLLFWLTTCGPCRRELADLGALMPEWRVKYDFAFVPISIDFEHRYAQFEQRAAAYPWSSYVDLDREWPLVLPGGLNGVPQIFVFDREGELIFHRRKYQAGDLEALAACLENADQRE